MKKTIYAILLAGLLPALMLTAAPFIYRSESGLYNDQRGSFSGKTVDTITANLAQTFSFRIKDSGGYDAIELVKVVVWNTNDSSLTSTNSDRYKAVYIYDPQISAWALRPGSPSWNLSPTYCTAPPSSTSTNLVRFALVFTAGRQAEVDTSGKSWRITIVASNSAGEVSQISTNFYMKLVESYSGIAGSSLIGVPSPFSISESKTMNFFYQANDDAKITLKIYTIYGEPVYTVVDNADVTAGQVYNGSTDPRLEWDGKNGAGRTVASGIYSAILTSVGTGNTGTQTLVFNFAVYR